MIQVYVRKTGDNDGPLKTLKAFQRINVTAGKTAQANISLPWNSFEFFNRESSKMTVASGEYEVLYGTSSDEKDLKMTKVVLR